MSAAVSVFCSFLFLSLLSALSSSILSSPHNFFSQPFERLEPAQIAIVQYDSRPLRDYWLTSAVWNHYYTQLHGHQFIYYNLEKECHYQETKLADAWCKVKAMLQVDPSSHHRSSIIVVIGQ
jgi:hypothetical protein